MSETLSLCERLKQPVNLELLKAIATERKDKQLLWYVSPKNLDYEDKPRTDPVTEDELLSTVYSDGDENGFGKRQWKETRQTIKEYFTRRRIISEVLSKPFRRFPQLRSFPILSLSSGDYGWDTDGTQEYVPLEIAEIKKTRKSESRFVVYPVGIILNLSAEEKHPAANNPCLFAIGGDFRAYNRYSLRSIFSYETLKKL